MFQVGVDIVYLPRIAKAWGRHGPRFEAKFLHELERQRLRKFTDHHRQVQFLASRWAAKEAVFKALGPTTPRILFPEILLESTEKGAPNVVLTGQANTLVQPKQISLSISHDHDYAIAHALVLFEFET